MFPPFCLSVPDNLLLLGAATGVGWEGAFIKKKSLLFRMHKLSCLTGGFYASFKKINSKAPRDIFASMLGKS